MSSASAASGRRASARPSRGPRPSYVIKTVFSDDDQPGADGSSSEESERELDRPDLDEDEQPSGSTSKAGSPEKKQKAPPKKRSAAAKRGNTADTLDREEDDGADDRDEPDGDDPAPRSSPTKKTKSKPPARGKKKKVVDSDEDMDDSGSAFDPGEADEEPADDDDGDAQSMVDEDEDESVFSGSDASGSIQSNSKRGGRGGGWSSVVGGYGSGRAPRPTNHPRLPTPPKTVVTTTSLPTIPKPSAHRTQSQAAPQSKTSAFVGSMHSEHLPPLVNHFTSCLLEAPGLGRSSVIGQLQVRGGQRVDGGSAMSEGAMAERTRVMTTEAQAMPRWEGWAGGIGEGGEGWRPKDVDGTTTSVWEGVGGEDGWKSCTELSEAQASPYLPSPIDASPHLISTGLIDNVEGGPIQQSQSSIPVYTAQSLHSLNIPKSGCLINPGGPTRSMDWCPMTEAESAKRSFKLYLALAAQPLLESSPDVGYSKASDTPGSIQIWSTSPKSVSATADKDKGKGKGKARETDMDVDEVAAKPGGDWDMSMQLEMVLCVEGGMCLELKWCPVGAQDELDEASGRVPKLGILAGVFEDGTVKLFAVPDPEQLSEARDREPRTGPIYLHLKPLTTLEVDDGVLSAFDWGSGRIIATGSTAGILSTWNVREAVVKGESHPLPLQHTQAHTAPVRRVTYLRHPETDANGDVHLDWEQPLVVSVGSNGRIVLTDLRDAAGSAGGGGASTCLSLSRGAGLVSAASSIQDGCVYYGDIDCEVQKMRIRCSYNASNTRFAQHAGQVWDVSHSDFHPTIAAASADGSLSCTPTMRGTSKNKRSWVRLMEEIYRVDHNELTGEFRLIDNILPQNVATSKAVSASTILPRVPRTATDKPAKAVNAPRQPHPAWLAQTGILCCAWNDGCGIGRAGMLASGMACGLARVDVLEGRWRGGGGLKKDELKELRMGLVKE